MRLPAMDLRLAFRQAQALAAAIETGNLSRIWTRSRADYSASPCGWVNSCANWDSMIICVSELCAF